MRRRSAWLLGVLMLIDAQALAQVNPAAAPSPSATVPAAEQEPPPTGPSPSDASGTTTTATATTTATVAAVSSDDTAPLAAPGTEPAVLATAAAASAGDPGPVAAPGAQQRGDSEADAAPAPGPYRLTEALTLPPWLRIALRHRTRAAYLRPQFRSGVPGNGRALSLRTILRAEARGGWWRSTLELIDSRAYLLGAHTPVDNGIVDTLDILQAYAGVHGQDLWLLGDRGHVHLGRMTVDLGTRRLIARNNFRNTINTFTGLDVQWSEPRGGGLQLLVLTPVRRLPADREALRDNTPRLDGEALGTWLWALIVDGRTWRHDLHNQVAVLGLHEVDTPREETRNRQLLTPAARLYRDPRPGRLDLDLEFAYQLGTSHASAARTDTRRLRHRAALLHAALGHTFAVPGAPRVAVLYDHATGDHDPDDRRNGRFDTLYGARRFDFGPTGIYGLLARENLRSPALRLQLEPGAAVDIMLEHRLAWLAEAADAWTTSGLRDPSGRAGTFLGQQLQARLRYAPWPGNVRLEAGFAHAWLGRYAARASAEGTAPANPTYVYAQVSAQL